jgi:hypothetical protein
VTCVVTEADRPHAFAWVVLDDSGDPGRPSSSWRYQIAPLPGGRTRVRQRFIHGPGVSYLRVIAAQVPDRAAEIIAARRDGLQASMTATLRAMKAAAESLMVLAVEAGVAAALPRLGPVADVLRQRCGPPERLVRRIFAQFADGAQLDLAVIAEDEVRRGDGAPDFVSLYRAAWPPGDDVRVQAGPAGRGHPSAYLVTGEQVREWSFLGWCALIDADKYLRRGSLWEAHSRLHEARHHMWALWAAASGALYPWHGLSQVLDHGTGGLPAGIETTVAGLDAAALRRAAQASAAVLSLVSTAAAQRCQAELPAAMARYVADILNGVTER